MRPICAGVLALAIAAAGCGRQDELPGRSPPATELVVTVRPEGAGGASERRAVDCDDEDRDPLCARLADVEVDDFAPVPEARRCTAVYGGPATATVTGRLRGRRVGARFSLRDGCEIARWQRFAWLLGPPPPGVALPP